MITTVIASDGMPIEITDTPYGTSSKSNVKYSIKQPLMKRDQKRAGKTIYVAPCWELTYDEDGYCVRMAKVSKAPAVPKTFAFTNEEYKPTWIEFVPGTNNKVKYCEGTAASDDNGATWAVYDGATNYCGTFVVATKAIDLNGEDETDEYYLSFVKAAMKHLGI